MDRIRIMMEQRPKRFVGVIASSLPIIVGISNNWWNYSLGSSLNIPLTVAGTIMFAIGLFLIKQESEEYQRNLGGEKV